MRRGAQTLLNSRKCLFLHECYLLKIHGKLSLTSLSLMCGVVAGAGFEGCTLMPPYFSQKLKTLSHAGGRLLCVSSYLPWQLMSLPILAAWHRRMQQLLQAALQQLGR